jgi:hypothetical protein
VSEAAAPDGADSCWLESDLEGRILEVGGEVRALSEYGLASNGSWCNDVQRSAAVD